MLDKAIRSPRGTVFRAPRSAAPEPRYFDDQGDEVVPSNASTRQSPESLTTNERLKILYRVNTRISTNALLTTGEMSTPAQYLATVTIQIDANPSNRTLSFGSDELFTQTPGVVVKTFAAQLAKYD